jgi:hypothetical protein
MYSGEYDYDYAQYLEDLEDPLGITPSKGYEDSTLAKQNFVLLFLTQWRFQA